MFIEHNSHNSYYRNPFGAVQSLSKITLRLCVSEGEIPASINLKYYCSTNPKNLITVNMAYVNTVAKNNFYEAQICAPQKPCLLHYYFEVNLNSGSLYYGNNEMMYGGIGNECCSNEIKPYQITVYSSEFKVPEWFSGIVMYQIFPDRFYKEHSLLYKRDDIIVHNWDDTPFSTKEEFGGEYLNNDFFGGNLNGILKKLPYLKELGINCIYLNPIFKAYSNHKYDTGNFEEIDETFGTEDDFTCLCTEAEKLGIRIILDGVFNHVGANSKYFNKNNSYNSMGAYNSPQSPYYGWFKFKKYPNEYESWWGIKTLPDINELNESYVDYILTSENSIVKKWLKKGASGYRLDVADELPDEFLRILRHEVKKQNPNGLIIGEVWEDASNKVSYGKLREYLYGSELDSVMNYPQRTAIIRFVKNEISSDIFSNELMKLKENYPPCVYHSLMNFLSSHDVERILTAVSTDSSTIGNDDIKRLKCAVFMQMTLPGIPCIYYGDEAGMTGAKDPFNRKTYPWGNENPEIMKFYKYIIHLRNSHNALKYGDFIPEFKYDTVFGYSRIYKNEHLTAVVNTHPTEEKFVRIDLARFNIASGVDVITNEIIEFCNGIMCFNLSPLSYRIINCKQS